MEELVFTPKGRGIFVAIIKPAAGKDEAGQATTPKYTLRLVFDPGTDLSGLQKLVESVMVEKHGPDATKWPEQWRKPFRKIKDLDKPIEGLSPDAVFITATAKAEHKPGVVDAKCQDILDDSQCYSGAYYRAQIAAYWYSHKGNKGVAFGLRNVQKMADGAPLGGRAPASAVFEAVEGVTDARSSMFD